MSVGEGFVCQKKEKEKKNSWKTEKRKKSVKKSKKKSWKEEKISSKC